MEDSLLERVDSLQVLLVTCTLHLSLLGSCAGHALVLLQQAPALLQLAQQLRLVRAARSAVHQHSMLKRLVCVA